MCIKRLTVLLECCEVGGLGARQLWAPNYGKSYGQERQVWWSCGYRHSGKHLPFHAYWNAFSSTKQQGIYMTLPLNTQTSLSSCHCLTTCQQSGCRNTVPILHNFIDSGAMWMTKPSIVRYHSTSQHTEPALMLVVHLSCTDILHSEKNVVDSVATTSPSLSLCLFLVTWRSQSGRLKVVP